MLIGLNFEGYMDLLWYVFKLFRYWLVHFFIGDFYALSFIGRIMIVVIVRNFIFNVAKFDVKVIM